MNENGIIMIHITFSVAAQAPRSCPWCTMQSSRPEGHPWCEDDTPFKSSPILLLIRALANVNDYKDSHQLPGATGNTMALTLTIESLFISRMVYD